MANLHQSQRFCPERPLPSPSGNSTVSTQLKGVHSRRPETLVKSPQQPYPNSTYQPSVLGYWGPQFRPNSMDAATVSRQQMPPNTMPKPKAQQHQSQYFHRTDPTHGAKPFNSRPTNAYPNILPNPITPIQQKLPVVSATAPAKSSKHPEVSYSQAGAGPLSHTHRQLFPYDPNQASVLNMDPSRHYNAPLSRLAQPQAGFHGAVGYFTNLSVDFPRTSTPAAADHNQLVDWGACSGSIHSSIEQQSGRAFPQRLEQNETIAAPASSQPADLCYASNLQHMHRGFQTDHQRAHRESQDRLLQHRGRTPIPGASEAPNGEGPNPKRSKRLF